MELTKNSSQSEIKQYFLKIVELKQSSEEFPVDLDEVWMLVYSRKDVAVKDLLNNFMQSVDYQVFHQKTENSKGGRPIEKYNISVSCLEYFIARKVRSVFDVYRGVFHKAIQEPKTVDFSDANAILKLAQNFVEEQQKRLALEQKTELQSVELKKQAPKVAYHDEVLQSKSTYNTNQIAKEIGTSARTLNKRLNELSVQYKQNKTWLLYSKHQNKGYTKTKTHTYTNTLGETLTSMLTVWTEKGRQFILLLLKEQDVA